MRVLIAIGCIFLYALFGYIFATVLLSLGDDVCERIAPWVTTNDPGFSLYLGCTLWPFLIVIMIFIAFFKVIEIVGNKLSILPVTVALAIKYMIDKKEVKMTVKIDLIKPNADGDKYLMYENVVAVQDDVDIIKREKWLRIVFDDGEIKRINANNIKSIEVRR